MSKHTPGPWTAFEARQSKDTHPSLGPRFEACVRVGAESNAGNAIAIVYMGAEGATSSRQGDVYANARLIAAAPELLSALEAVLAFEDPDSLEDQQTDARLRAARAEAWERAKDVIAKATGEQP